MQQKEVKIIGLSINQQMGILQSCQLKFDPNNKLIAVKGEVGAGKTTLQKSLMLGTVGSDTLKDDKKLYGSIDEEVQLLDGDINIFVGCKSNSNGGLDYVLYTKDETGKKIKDPVIDGVKCTPATYLKNLQTALTWRMEELMSENSTVQKKLLLELYKSELAKIGVVFDKKSTEYSESILGRIELAENERSQKDFVRKQVGGFDNQLKPLGIDVENAETLPQRVDISDLEKKKNKLQYDIENISQANDQKLQELKNKADAVVNQLKEKNVEIGKRNAVKEAKFEAQKQQYSQNTHTFNGLLTDLETLVDNGCLTKENGAFLVQYFQDNFKNNGAVCEQLEELIQFDENGKCITKEHQDSSVVELLTNLNNYKRLYVEVLNQPAGDTSTFEKELEDIVNQMYLAKENNKKCDMVDAYLDWKSANQKVVELKNEYAEMLSSINTGVEGLNICVDKEEDKLDIYLTYDGRFDAKYFNNPTNEPRKLSSYSGTQKPLICLLLQNYLLSKKPKAMRYLWIDNIPIDAKTKVLLEKMGNDLGLTIIVNITGDFTKDNLENGEILIEGGQVFFN